MKPLALIWKKWPKVCDEGGRLGWWEVEVGSGHQLKRRKMRIQVLGVPEVDILGVKMVQSAKNENF